MPGKHREIGDRLRLIEDRDFEGDRERFAKVLGISYEMLTNYVNGYARPGNKTQQRLRDQGFEVEWIMTGKSGQKATRSKPIIALHQPGGMTKQTRERLDKLIKLLEKGTRKTDEELLDLIIKTMEDHQKKK